MIMEPQYSEQKLSELMLYVAAKCERQPFFGAVKLNKILFFADFCAYFNRGRPITGSPYQRNDFGPTPVRLLSVRNALEISGSAILRADVVPGGHTQKRLIPLRPADLSLFEAEEIAIVDYVIEHLRDMNGTEVSDLSHRFPGWKLAERGERIPYYTVFIPAQIRQLSSKDADWARSVVRRIAA